MEVTLHSVALTLPVLGRSSHGSIESPIAHVAENRVVDSFSDDQDTVRISQDGFAQERGEQKPDTHSASYQDPRVEAKNKEAEQKLVDQQVSQLAQRDRVVRAHEQAHMAVGGQYAGSASYEYQRGPNGVSYAVGGEVPISTGPAATPEETIRKAQIIRNAALAPAEPSPQDRRVASMATQLETKARNEIAQVKNEEASTEVEEDVEETSVENAEASGKSSDEVVADEKPPSGLRELKISDNNLLFSFDKSHVGKLLSDHA